ncbi:unnamed protein product [Rotaria sordida]|uniref:Uncharacterized protein n=1 Tax=Rotaria sordida TaxID=392033 RepID=A0A819EKS2_9BILA|nr:unnamed protein product [Rotaria sordida]CAF3852545.1 unnamed protein product [Rotaria sordida]
MTNTFLSTSKRSDVADMFAAYNRTEHKLDGEDKEGEVSIGYTFIIKNINGYRRALDISDISERPHRIMDTPEVVSLNQSFVLPRKSSKMQYESPPHSATSHSR